MEGKVKVMNFGSPRSDHGGHPGNRGLYTEWILAATTELSSGRGANSTVLPATQG